MSNVGLSNGSPTLERMDGRPSDRPKPSACRSLFGTVDHEALTRELKGHLRGMDEASSAKWSFDFSNHRPLPFGRFEWQVVDSKDVPEFYNRPQRPKKDLCASGKTDVDLNGNRNCRAEVPCQESVGGRFSEENAETPESPVDCKDQCSGQRKRPASHDSSTQTKRSHPSPDGAPSSPVSGRSVEHTPRKASPRTQT